MSTSIDKLIDEALSYHRKGQISEAAELYQKALTLEPLHPTALHLLGVIRHQEGKNVEAEKLIKQALNITPNDFMAMSNLGSTYQALGKFNEATKIFTQVITKQPSNPQIYVNRGNAFRGAKQNLEAAKDYRSALQQDPRLFEAARNLGLCLQEEGHFNEARHALEHCIKLAPKLPEARVSLANLYRETGHLDAAKTQYETALSLAPNVSGIYCDLAIVLRDIGDLDAARNHYESALKLEPQLGRAWRGVAGLKVYKDQSELGPMQDALNDTKDDNAKMHIEFALGKAREDLRDYDEAFQHFKEGNALHARSFTYDIKDDLAFFGNLESKANAAFLNKNSGNGSSSTRPIFIIGMPRSGTSLVEQILASHSRVYGGGELSILSDTIASILPMRDDQDYSTALDKASPSDFEAIADIYLKSLASQCASDSDYIVDKMPMNFMHVGLITLAFPKACIIHCRRAPLDNCLSIFKNYLPARGHRYAADLETLGRYYNGYRKLMKHWQSTSIPTIFDIDYDDLVSNPEKLTRNLLTSCGLQFEDACLTPHKTQRVVSTLSAAQVRRPINIKSVGISQKYEDHLSLLRDILHAG